MFVDVAFVSILINGFQDTFFIVQLSWEHISLPQTEHVKICKWQLKSVLT